VAPQLTVTAINALGDPTLNYGNELWFYAPDISDGISSQDSSTYVSTGTITEVFTASASLLAEQNEYLDGQGTVTINNVNFRYNKVDGSHIAYAALDPFSPSVNFTFSAAFFDGRRWRVLPKCLSGPL